MANTRALTSLTRRDAPPSHGGRGYFGAAALLCTGLLLVGCAVESPRQPAAASPSATAPARPASIDDDAYLQSLYADPRLDPIRDKVPLLLRPDAIKPAYLTNDAKPTLPEKQAITAWLQIRERAQRYQAAQRGEPSPLLIQTRVRVTEAIVQLYSERLSYAEFARRIQQIDEQYQAAARQRVGLHN